MRTLYLHIGFHKTGSSSLQLALKQNGARLLEQGFEFVSLGKKGNSSGAIEVEAEGPDLSFRLNGRFRQLLSTTAGERVIVSAEHFSFLHQAADIRQVAGVCGEFFERTVVIAYLRRQDLHARSFKQQGARGCEAGRSSSSKLLGHGDGAFPEFTPPVNTYYDYAAKLHQWREIFGRDALVVREFEPAQLNGGDLVTDFAGLLGGDVRIPPCRVNEGVSRKEFLLTHKLIQLRLAPAEIRRLKPMMQRDEARLQPAREDAEAFFRHFADSNRRLNEEFLRHESGLAFSEDFSAYPVAGNDHLSFGDLAQWSADLFAAGLQNPGGLRDALLADRARALADAATTAEDLAGELRALERCLAQTAGITPARNTWWQRIRGRKRSGR
ncbi:hypothetical protein [Microbulbifer yueqingensis]|uniref:Uncharacterized protein n=1 Tax=Microbulbifer yueqingensis TaxID=658219 RepID=A0A1G8X2P2_9GAMM|nr:hypothetical protein [Microbulbifer yueqingensis]SDJ84918.1 hypothetical protein SAMN05216212_0943 [Microbulbifer yueqingensis]